MLSVPFSSGQWLLQDEQRQTRSVTVFQSPFHRGNGCYKVRRDFSLTCMRAFSPLFIGAMVATVPVSPGNFVRKYTFSPLFIGAMVATRRRWQIARIVKSFSPLFIGAMVATCDNPVSFIQQPIFQSPFHRGNGCYQGKEVAAFTFVRLSVPFSSGQWLLLDPVNSLRKTRTAFSPLFIGAMVATKSKHVSRA